MPFQGTRSKCRKLLKDLAEFRTIGARKRIRTRSNELEAWLDKDRACAQKRFNSDIRLFKQRKIHPLQVQQRLSYNNSQKQSCGRQTDSTRKTSLPSISLPEDNQSKRTGITRQRSYTVSLPVQHNDMKMLDNNMTSVRKPLRVDINATKLLESDSSPLKPFPGLTAGQGEIFIATRDDSHIPKSVLQRGRRMSRSVSNMNELVRQELSDYIDKKSSHLPDVSKLNTAATSTPPPPYVRQKSAQNISSSYKMSANVHSKSNINIQKISPRSRNSSLSEENSDHELLSPCDEGVSLPSPPLMPRPPTQASRNNRRIRRPQQAVPKLATGE